MTPERWQQVERLYHEALRLDASQRAAFLRGVCPDDDAIRSEVESLLAHENGADALLETPVAEVVAEMLGASLLGRQLGGYQVVSLLGVGGMGEVYEARDVKLGRAVALKVLPTAFLHDKERLARFEREARVLASLNHPNIATIHGLEQSEGVQYLVMELVPGQTLAEQIEKGAVALEDALKVAQQIAEALEAAHEKGIIHRDLKPANVKVTPEGRVKVLDFGLAKALIGDSNPDLSNMPALSEEGRVLGTPAYMSPEQARGLPVDKRTDIWAFGCVLYEMLTGRSPFASETVPDAIVAILKREPDWTALPQPTPPQIRDLLRRCLRKDAHRRLRDVGDARLEIEGALEAPGNVELEQSTALGHTPFWLAICLLLVGLTAVTVWRLRPPSPNGPGALARFLLPMPADVRLDTTFGTSIAISPDGSHLAFVAGLNAARRLYVREIRGTETKVLPGTEGAWQPFFSPDGQWLAFFADGKLKKIPTNGGPAVMLCDADSPRGGSWDTNDKIVFSPQARGRGILQVSSDGGVPKSITAPDTGQGETSHRTPQLLPGGQTILYTAYGATYQDVSIVAQSLKTGERRVLIQGASQPRYSSTGHLLYIQPKLPGTLMAVGFDPKSLKLSGPPVPLIDDVLTTRGDFAQWSISDSGMLVYSPGGFQQPEDNLVWVDRRGRIEPAGLPDRRSYGRPRLSPDGSRVVVTLAGIQSTLWIYNLAGRTFNRLTFEGNNDWPIWTPDGKKVTYSSNRAQPWRLFWKLADGSASEDLLLAALPDHDQQPYSWSPDGKVLVYEDQDPSTGQNIWVLPMDGQQRPRPFIQTPASEVDATLSPDGKWIAYASNESGRYEVYVQPFPGPGGKWQISTDGGREPVWARSNRELFFRSADKMMVVDVTAQPAFQADTPRLLFQGPYVTTTDIAANYDVSADGQRFLMVEPSEQRPALTGLNVVLNWFEELRRSAPTGK